MRAVLALGLCGCSSIFGLKAPQPTSDAGGDVSDGPADSSLDGIPGDAQQCFGSGEYEVCLDVLPAMTKSLTGNFSTQLIAGCTTGAHWVSSNQPPACFIAGTTVTVGPLVATGTLPLVIVATDRVTFTGLVDVSTHRGMATGGAGADSGPCGMAGTPGQANNGGGGGAGGSYSTGGGNGGDGTNGAAGGIAASTEATGLLRGGCAGEAGARGGGGQAGVPGGAGGALYAVAGGTIDLGSSTLAANGAGADRSQSRWGGSGGGAGGMIVLYAPSITAMSAIVMANGGGGASGNDSGTGNPGADPNPLTPDSAALGGQGLNANADGGPGFAGGSVGGNGQSSGGGVASGGGGGGGAGYIRANVPLAGATTSPNVDVIP